jgi:hypothetical protein
MASPVFERPVQRSLLLPPISALPAEKWTPQLSRAREPDVVGAVAGRARSWFGHPMDLPGRLTGALRTIQGGAAALAGYLVAVRVGAAPGSGLFYLIATLGHPGLLLILATVCVATLGGLAPFTRGLTRAGGPELAVMTAAGMAGVGALLGVAALALLTVLAGFLALAAIIAAFERN